MIRTKLRTLVQISNSQNYEDAYVGAHTGAVAEPVFNIQTLEYDLNIFRTQFKQLKGTNNWYDLVAEGTADGYTLTEIGTRLGNIQSFIGAGDGTDDTPDYSDHDSAKKCS